MSHFAWDNFRSPAALSRFFLTTILGLTADLCSKWCAFATLARSTPVMDRNGVYHVDSVSHVVVRHWLQFALTCNQGAVFGIGQGQRVLFLAISLAAIVFLTYLFAASDRQRFYQFVLGLLLAGVLGNMYDRLELGYVRDMIYALPGWKWPASNREVFPWIFNVADAMLCCGVGLLLVQGICKRPPSATRSPPKDPRSS